MVGVDGQPGAILNACEANARTECSWQNQRRTGPFYLAADFAWSTSRSRAGPL